MSDVGLCIRQPVAIDLDAIAHPQSGSSMATRRRNAVRLRRLKRPSNTWHQEKSLGEQPTFRTTSLRRKNHSHHALAACDHLLVGLSVLTNRAAVRLRLDSWAVFPQPVWSEISCSHTERGDILRHALLGR